MLLRDRKALLASMLTIIAYGAAVLVLVDWALRRGLPETAMLPPVMTPAIAALLWFNAVMLAWRLLMRAGFTAHAYGRREAIRAVPRALASNVINAAAAWAAVGRYRETLQSGTAPFWDKTAHQYPADAGL